MHVMIIVVISFMPGREGKTKNTGKKSSLSPSFVGVSHFSSPSFYVHFVINYHARLFPNSLKNWVKLTLPCGSGKELISDSEFS